MNDECYDIFSKIFYLLILDYPDYSSQNHYQSGEFDENKIKYEKDEDDRTKYENNKPPSEQEENGRIGEMGYEEDENY